MAKEPFYSDRLRVKRTFRGNGQQELIYYVQSIGSFNCVAKQHLRQLPKIGYTVYHVALEDVAKKAAIPLTLSDKSCWALIHPIFSSFQKKQEALENLRVGHPLLGGFDVADSDKLTEYAVNIANRLDLIMVPTQHSKEIYEESGVKTRTEVIPHGLNSSLYSQPKDPLPKIPKDGVKILYFLWHSELRKGADVVRDAIDKIFDEYPNVYLILKTPTQKLRHPRTIRIGTWLTEPDLVRLYDSCDILLSPSRGGGCELNVLEGMARGLIPIVSNWGAIQEYAAPYALTIRNMDKKAQPLPENEIHCGYGANPDSSHCYELIKHAIENLDDLKARAEEAAPQIRREHTWRKTAEHIVQCLET